MSDLSRRLSALERRRRHTPPSLPSGGRALTGEQLAGRLGVTGETVRRWASLGMPACGTHPARPSWPVYDERACREWAAEHQPQTALKPALDDSGNTDAGRGGEGGLAELRRRKLQVACERMRLKLQREASRLVRADQVREFAARHAGVVRARCRAVPGRAAASLAARYGVTPEDRADLERILDREIESVLDELSDDPLAGVATKEKFRGR